MAATRIAAVLGVVACAGALADDAELFTGLRSTTPTPANILLIIDTSGSMDTAVETQAPWNPGETYDGCYRGDSLYFSTSGTPPPCGSDNRVDKVANYCAVSRSRLEAVGYFRGPLLGWNADRLRWEAPSAGRATDPLECEADRGLDGGIGTGRFAADGASGPWSDDTATEPAWRESPTLYDGNWLNWNDNPPTITRTRLQIVQEVVSDLLDSLDNVNIGVLRFNRFEGGRVAHAVAPVDTARETIRSVVAGFGASGITPLAGTLYESALYLMGSAVDYGNEEPPPERSVAGSRVGGNPDGILYRTPLTAECGRSYIIILTDGEDFRGTTADRKITALPGFATLVGPACDGSGDGACIDDLAAYLHQADLSPGLPGQQNAVTHTIGFTVDSPALARIAERGGGEYYRADDTATLAGALQGIVSSISDSANTFTPPTIAVNAFNRTQNLSDVFIPAFQITGRTRWLGNLKKYRLVDGQLVGRDGQPAIDPATGGFDRDSWSFWSASPDGDRAVDGGAAARLPDYTLRRIYSNLVSGELTDAGNRLDPENDNIDSALLGVADDARTPLIEWALGRDVRDADGDGNDGESRRDMGDAFNARPATFIYGGSADAPVMTVFMATNDGYLHAIDARTGDELWAFIPQRQFARLNELFMDEATGLKTYGLDGRLRVHVVNDDGRPGLAGTERAILLFGMGRGGDGLYALDVSAREAPRLLWEIDSTNPAFADIGQTWSTPAVGRIRVGTAVRTVAIFGGGYDPGQDSGTFRTDTVGNAVYMVDLVSGEALWSAGGPAGATAHALVLDMQHSIPAPVSTIDLNGDGLLDRIYAADTGGRLWRFDVVNGNPPATLVEGGLLATLGAADLGASAPAESVRRFYVAPDIVLTRSSGRRAIAINIGSGYRGRPLDQVIDEQFFSVRDFDVYGVRDRDDYSSPIRISDLVDITGDPAPELPAEAAGWRLRLDEAPGEKVLGESLTLDNTVFFASFSPGDAVSECSSGVGTNRLYAISLFDGRPLTQFDTAIDDTPLTPADRSKPLVSAMPVSDILLYQSMTGETSICAGTECLSDDDIPGWAGNMPRRTYWSPAEAP